MTFARLAALSAALAFLLLVSGPAFAQYGGLPWYLSFDPSTGIGLSFMGRLAFSVCAFTLGLALGALIAPRFAEFRRYLKIALTILAGCIGFFGTGTFSLLALFALGIGLLFYGFSVAMGPHMEGRSTALGSSDWASLRQVIAGGLTKPGGFWLGNFTPQPSRQDRNPQPVPIYYNGDRHLLTVAPTRAGKGVSTIIPNLLTYEGSALVVDPKGENAIITLKARSEHIGQYVYVVDPWRVSTYHFDGLEPATINPMDWLVVGSPDIGENAMLLADALIVPSKRGESFFDEEAKALIAGIILHVATDPKQPERNLGRVRDLLTFDGEDWKLLLQQMKDSPEPGVVKTASRTLQKDPRTLANVLATAQAHTHFLDSPRIRESLAWSSFSFEFLKQHKVTIFLVLPADRLTTFNRWLRLLIQQAITVTARDLTQKPEKPILFLLDELPSLGPLTMVEQAYGLMAGYGMQLWGIVQNASQLKRLYGDGWETFIANSGVIQYFGSRDVMTSEYFSKLCGVTTIKTFSSSFSAAFSRNGGSTTHGHSTNQTQRPLVYPDELMTMRKGRQLLLVENLNPIAANKHTWYEHPALSPLGINLHQEEAPAAEEGTNSASGGPAAHDPHRHA